MVTSMKTISYIIFQGFRGGPIFSIIKDSLQRIIL